MRKDSEPGLDDICQVDFTVPEDRRPRRLMILLGMTCTAFALLSASTIMEIRDQAVAEASAPEVLASNAACAADLRTLAAQSAVYFGVDSAQLTAVDLRKTRRLFEAAQDCPGVTLQVWGHADGSGDEVENLALSHQRARNVLVAIETMGFDANRVEVLAAGASMPLAQGDADDALDRRVEFAVVPAE